MYGVVWQEERNGRLITRERTDFETEDAMTAFIETLFDRASFYGVIEFGMRITNNG